MAKVWRCSAASGENQSIGSATTEEHRHRRRRGSIRLSSTSRQALKGGGKAAVSSA